MDVSGITRATSLEHLFNNAGIEGKISAIVDQSGSIINTSSVGGLIGAPCMAPYVASKHAVIGIWYQWPKQLRT